MASGLEWQKWGWSKRWRGETFQRKIQQNLMCSCAGSSLVQLVTETQQVLPASLPKFLSHRNQHTCNARVSWEGSVENIKASLAHGCGDQVVFEGRYHTAGAAGRHGSLGVSVMWGAECLQLPIKSWNASTALSYCKAQLLKIIPTQLDPHKALLHMTKGL